MGEPAAGSAGGVARAPRGEAPLVAIRALSKHYVRGDQVITVLAGIDLDVRRGDYIALMGPSGSGKSTLLNLIAGIDKPTSGEIRIAGVDIAGLSDAALAAWRAAHVGFIFQFYHLMPVLTAFENVELPLLLSGLARRERRERVDRRWSWSASATAPCTARASSRAASSSAWRSRARSSPTRR